MLRKWLIISLLLIAGALIFFQSHLVSKKFVALGATINEDCPWCIEYEDNKTKDSLFFVNIASWMLAADNHMVADYLWMKVVYYFGRESLMEGNFENLFDFFDMLTSLDSYWLAPFEYAGLMLPVFADNPDGGYDLVLKGLKYHGREWRLHFIKGYIELKFFDHLEMASQSLFDASTKDGAPKMLLYYSATLANRSSQSSLTEMIVREGLKNLATDEERNRLLEKLEK